MSVTGTHHMAPLATSAVIAPRTRTLSASGSRKAPERVAPWRRASHPSARSLTARTNQSPSACHSVSVPRIRRMTIGRATTRAMVIALAGVASAVGPNEDVDIGPAPCLEGFEVDAGGARDLHVREGTRRVVIGRAQLYIILGCIR